jgi:hypothetical protein
MADTNDVVVKKELSEAQAYHLQFLEKWADEKGVEIVGVNVVQALDYFLIQQINHLYLLSFLERQPQNA